MSMLSKPVHVSLGAYGRVPHLVAIADALADPPSDPLLGRLDTSRMQLCPQNRSMASSTWQTGQNIRAISGSWQNYRKHWRLQPTRLMPVNAVKPACGK